nr:LOW QUALITY PROTEIN: zona pellucida-binding protein 2-like [Columba livia]
MFHNVQWGRMLCAPRIWPDLGRLRVLGTVGILTLVLCSCSGQPASPPWDLPGSSNWEHQRDLIFIHMESSLYSLPCSPMEMGVEDPTYHWVQDRAAAKLFSVTKDGHLLFQHFQAEDSGKYSCTISYTKRGVPLSQTFRYSIFGYHVPGGLDIVLLFHSKLCEDEWTKRFLQNLQEMLRPLEFEQHCKLQLTGTSCFPSLSDPPNEFIIQVQLKVSPFGPHWDEHCRSNNMESITDCYRKKVQHNLEQVQLAFTTFFKEHKFVHVTGADIPSIHFTNEFVGFLKTEECDAGYGQTKQLQRCLDCCITCPPGMFSPPKNRQCFLCPVGTYSLTYGAVSCTRCKDGTTTKDPGAISMLFCVKEEMTKQVVAVMHKVPVLLLILLPVLLGINVLFLLCCCYWFYKDHHVSSPRASKKTGKTTRMERVTRFFRIPMKGPQAGPDAGPASDTSASPGADDEYTPGAPSLATTPNSAAVADETTPMLGVKDRKTIFEIPFMCTTLTRQHASSHHCPFGLCPQPPHTG